MNDETAIQFEQFTDTTTLVTANGGYIGEIAIDEDGEAQIDFNMCWLTRTDLEAIVNKMRELERNERRNKTNSNAGSSRQRICPYIM